MSRRLLLACCAVVGFACGSAAHQGAVAPASPASPAPYSPTPTATPSAAPTATQEPVALRPPTPVPPKVVTVITNRFQGPGVDVPIGGSVRSCTAATRPVPKYDAWFDSCQPGLWFLCDVAQCPSMNGWGSGTRVTWWDGGGIPHTYTITTSAVFPAGSRVSVPGSVHFQVCTSASGASVRVLSA